LIKLPQSDASYFLNKKWVKNIILFLFCFAIISGPAYALFDSYDYDLIASPDIKSYLGLANFDFDQSPVRKYRVIIPFLAAGINYIFGPAFSLVAPNTFPGPDFSMCLSFLIINSIFMSVFGMIVYYLCKEFGVSRLAAIVGILSVLTCRWTAYIAGLPLVDSLYMVVIAMTLLGINRKDSKLLILAIFLGPWAKESFILIAPLIFFFGHLNKWKQLILFAASGIIIFCFRYFIDEFNVQALSSGLKTDFDHLANVSDSLVRLFSFHGLYEIFSLAGIWGLAFILIIFKLFRTALKQKTPLYLLLFLLLVFLHALLSTDLARMFYLATPVMAIWISILSDKIISIKKGTESLAE